MEAIKYIRFGQLPEGGRSRNHADGALEAGVSCYRARRIDGKWLVDGAYGSYRMLSASGLPLYEITGVEIGTGSDGEPVLADAVIVRRTRIKIAGDCWVSQANSAIGATEKIYKHLITGRIWCALSGCEFRCDGAEFAAKLRIFSPRRAEAILANA